MQDTHALFPVSMDVDLLVVGGSSAGVALALAASRAGASVFLAAPRPYLGEDIADTFRFWPGAEAPATDLAKEIFSDAPNPAMPLHVKLTLEQSLVRAGIPFLFNTLPAGLLLRADGQVGGMFLANRAGRMAVRANVVVDATPAALVARQSGDAASQAPRGRQLVRHVTLCEGAGSAAPGLACRDLAGFATQPQPLSAREYVLEVDLGSGDAWDFARAAAGVGIRCRVPGEFRHQPWLTLQEADASAASRPDMAQVTLPNGVVVLSEGRRLPGNAHRSFAHACQAMSLGESFGRQLAARRAPLPRGELTLACAGSVPVGEGSIKVIRDESAGRAKPGDLVRVDLSSLPMLGEVDVLVAGGGTGGSPAAISAARAGARTLVIEATSGLGGVGTMGQISRYWYGNRVGFTSEIDRGVAALEVTEEFKAGKGAWSVAAKRAWYEQSCHEEGATVWLHSHCVGVWQVGERVRGVVVAGPYGYGLVKAGCVVDSTGCADIPAAAGAPVVEIGGEHVAVQGTGLAGIRPGLEYRNSDHGFSDDTQPTDTTAFLASAKLKFKGDFDCGELIDSRERRQIVGDFSLGPADFLYNRRFPDTLCVASSNFDTHGFTVHPAFFLIPPGEHRLWADIPFRCFLPRGLDGVLVTGLGISAHRDALPVIRMQPDVQNQGYVAGRIAAESARKQCPVRGVDLPALQKHLVDIGNLPERVLADQDNFPLPDAALEEALREGIDRLEGVCLLLNETGRSLPMAKAALAATPATDAPRRARLAILLAYMDDASGASVLRDQVAAQAWDVGWNYRGMGQFGMSLSPVDTALIALGKVGGKDAWPVLADKFATIDQPPTFSHVRALVTACESLHARHPDARAAEGLLALLAKPGVAGHAQRDLREVQAALTDNINENDVRNRALTELHIARGLFRCGDPDGSGQRILEDYRRDLRGHFARHARAILAGG